MPNFRYRVRDRSGRAVAGMMEAPTSIVAGTRLYQLGYLPVKIEEEKESVALNLSHLWRRLQKVKPEDLIFFSQQLSTLYKAGLPLLSSLENLKEQTENKRLKPVLEATGREIQGGKRLFEALSDHPEVFPSVYLNMIRAGETSGRLGESLDRYATLADRELKTHQRVKEATRYPKIVLLSVAIAFVILVTFVIPRFAQVFSGFHTPLPFLTRGMIGINHVLQQYWFLVIGLLIGIPVLMKQYLQTEKGRFFWGHLKTRIPTFGPLFSKMALSQFAYTFVMLNRSGIPILETLEIASSAVNDVVFARAVEEVSRKVREGRSLAEAMKESGQFTPLVVQMVAVGESSGTLDEMLTRVTEYYDLEVKNGIKKLSTYIEPTMTLLLGVVVLLLGLAVFLPWWNMASLMR